MMTLALIGYGTLWLAIGLVMAWTLQGGSKR